MNENIKTADLSHLSTRLVKAARDFADLKFQIDTAARISPDNIPNDLHGTMTYGDYGPMFGRYFLIT